MFRQLRRCARRDALMMLLRFRYMRAAAFGFDAAAFATPLTLRVMMLIFDCATLLFICHDYLRRHFLPLRHTPPPMLYFSPITPLLMLFSPLLSRHAIHAALPP